MASTKLFTVAPVVVAAPGTPVQLMPTNGPICHSVIVTALPTNKGTMAVGDSHVVAAPGTHAAPTLRGTPLAAGQSESVDINDLTAIFLDAVEAGDGVTALATIA